MVADTNVAIHILYMLISIYRGMDVDNDNQQNKNYDTFTPVAIFILFYSSKYQPRSQS